MSLVDLKGVSRSFDDVRAVDDVSFSIDRGEIVGFLGPNGAGKTTTMRLITQALQPDTGEIRIDGVLLEEGSTAVRRRIGYLAETNPLYEEMLVSEFLTYMARLRDIPEPDVQDRIDPAVEETGIAEVYYRPIAHLSKGYRQRVGLAQAILSEPDILILDEPTEGLDPNQRVEIRKLITRLGRDHTVLLSTHVMHEVQAVCDRLLIIHRGKIIADGGVNSLLAGESRGARVRVEIEADSTAAREELGKLPSVSEVLDAGDGGARPRFIVVGTGDSDPRPDIFGLTRDRGWTLWEMTRQREDLEQFFRDLTESA
jgi:ABC-2 type transport system ATP-binding protein